MEQFENKTQTDQSYGIYILTWLGIVILTGFTIAVAGISSGSLYVILALSVSAIQSFLIFRIFTRLNSGDKKLKVFASLTGAVFIILLILL